MASSSRTSSSQTDTRTSESSSRPLRPTSPPAMYGHYDTATAKPPTPSRRPRPRSPPSMYVCYDTPTTKPPRPLIKLDKTPKSRPSPNPAARKLSPTSNSGRSAVGLFLKARGRASPAPPTSFQSTPIIVSEESERTQFGRLYRSSEPAARTPQRSEDITRLPMVSAQNNVLPAPDEETRWCSMLESDMSSFGHGSSTLEESCDDDHLIDHLHCDRRSTPPSPIEFAPTLRSPLFIAPDDAVQWVVHAGSRPNTASTYAGRLSTTQTVTMEWEGEWNQPDMQSVIDKLRLLK